MPTDRINREEQNLGFGFQSEREARFPPLVQLALMHYICNSRCRRCPVGLCNRGQMGGAGEYDPARRRFFPFESFGKIADEMGKHPWSILRFHGRGEPLLHPHYVDMIACAKKAGVGTVTSFTNATLLDEEKANAILDAGLDLMELSIDAYTEDRYREFRGTDYFKQVVQNAESFIRARNQKRCGTKVIVSAVDCPEFQPEKEEFRRFWSERADEVIFRPYHTYGGRLPLICARPPEEVVPCSQLWMRFSINPWGQVNACFNDWADEVLVGDLNDPGATIAQIWRGTEFDALREASLQGHSILKCCGTCLATRKGWVETYQRLLGKLRDRAPNRNLV